jgi:phosphatidylinositol-bisphosphatase
MANQITFNLFFVCFQELNSGKDVLEDILVLHLENGPDYFVNASGDYARSCFGCQLEELVCTTDPIRNVPIAFSADGHRHFASPLTGSTLSVPKELWRLVDAIFQRGLQERNLFLTQGNPIEVRFDRCFSTWPDSDLLSCIVVDRLNGFAKVWTQELSSSLAVCMLSQMHYGHSSTASLSL